MRYYQPIQNMYNWSSKQIKGGIIRCNIFGRNNGWKFPKFSEKHEDINPRILAKSKHDEYKRKKKPRIGFCIQQKWSSKL